MNTMAVYSAATSPIADVTCPAKPLKESVIDDVAAL